MKFVFNVRLHHNYRKLNVQIQRGHVIIHIITIALVDGLKTNQPALWVFNILNLYFSV